jgi:hypothetical protein
MKRERSKRWNSAYIPTSFDMLLFAVTLLYFCSATVAQTPRHPYEASCGTVAEFDEQIRRGTRIDGWRVLRSARTIDGRRYNRVLRFDGRVLAYMNVIVKSGKRYFEYVYLPDGAQNGTRFQSLNAVSVAGFGETRSYPTLGLRRKHIAFVSESGDGWAFEYPYRIGSAREKMNSYIAEERPYGVIFEGWFTKIDCEF